MARGRVSVGKLCHDGNFLGNLGGERNRIIFEDVVGDEAEQL